MVTKKEQKAAEVLENKKTAYANKVRALLGHVSGRVPAKELLAAFTAGTAAETFAATVAAREPVGAAIHAQKAEAVAYAEKSARETVERVRKELEAAGWDREAVASYPKGDSWNNPRYDAERARYSLFAELSKSDPALGYQSYKRGGVYLVVIDSDMVERFVRNAMLDAALQYDSFICKMVGKVGEVVSAELSGSHIWAHSLLLVEKADGTRETWKTQQIVNSTKYGRPYLQWPSRKVGK